MLRYPSVLTDWKSNVADDAKQWCRKPNQLAPGQHDSRVSASGGRNVGNTVLVSHSDWDVITELEFRCIYQKYAACSRAPTIDPGTGYIVPSVPIPSQRH